MTASSRSDLVVIGGGPGGYVAAIRAAQLEIDVTLIDADALGGTCLNYGCIPSKALLSAAGLVHEASHRESAGIYADPYVEWSELLEWGSGIIDQLTGGVEQLCEAANVDLLAGRATFVDETELTVETSDGDERTVSFEHAIIATGSRPIELPGFPFENDRVMTSRDVFSLEELPRRLVIIGAGYIGLELATLFQKLGVDVTVLEYEDDVLPGWDDDLRQMIRSHVESLGVTFVFGELAADCTVDSSQVTVTTELDSGEKNYYEADRAIVAVGRQPVTDSVDLENAGIEVTDAGFIAIDGSCRTNLEHVFAVGDVAGEPMLAHKASAEGIVAAETIAGLDASIDDHVIPAVVFTDPEVATVGLSETAAAEAGFEPVVGRMPFGASGRALTTNSPEGFVRVVVDEPSGTLLGAQVVGEHASELAGELTLAITAEISAEAVAETVHAHPTLSESVMEACAAALGKAIHTT
ncbi:dihydrolipoyl dehydrogenase [Natronosalvus rutilus]|uniref:Dihydrolipoyl dehydrogenase n=1 Tax=Natronosalvus rutilus TaxID=2953753 RepID=A0A9E7NCH8_9EURY|nr:dihydrolipoyl dehydrogenase [Natronosalvus rutilus]UTF55757.1 dihydrolipoyl dehydrogenase [Natronosalvus rutilus]